MHDLIRAYFQIVPAADLDQLSTDLGIDLDAAKASIDQIDGLSVSFGWYRKNAGGEALGHQPARSSTPKGGASVGAVTTSQSDNSKCFLAAQ